MGGFGVRSLSHESIDDVLGVSFPHEGFECNVAVMVCDMEHRPICPSVFHNFLSSTSRCFEHTRKNNQIKEEGEDDFTATSSSTSSSNNTSTRHISLHTVRVASRRDGPRIRTHHFMAIVGSIVCCSSTTSLSRRHHPFLLWRWSYYYGEKEC